MKDKKLTHKQLQDLMFNTCTGAFLGIWQDIDKRITTLEARLIVTATLTGLGIGLEIAGYERELLVKISKKVSRLAIQTIISADEPKKKPRKNSAKKG